MYHIYKNRIYVKNPVDAPKGVKVETGERGGIYYESEGQSTQEKPQEQSFESKLKSNEIPDSDYKNQLTYLNSEQLTKEINKIYKDSPNLDYAIRNWYRSDDAHFYLDNNISKVFELNPNTSRKSKEYSEQYNINIDAIKKLYTITQIHLRKKYPNGKIVLYRGVDGKTFDKFKDIPENSKINLDSYNISSWTERSQTALEFAKASRKGVIVMIEVPIERIFSHYEIDPWALKGEKEAILIGSEVQGTLLGKYQYKE